MQAVSDEGMRSRIGWVTSEKIRKKLRKMLDIHNQLWYNAQAVSRGTTQQTLDEAEQKNSEKNPKKVAKNAWHWKSDMIWCQSCLEGKHFARMSFGDRKKFRKKSEKSCEKRLTREYKLWYNSWALPHRGSGPNCCSVMQIKNRIRKKRFFVTLQNSFCQFFWANNSTQNKVSKKITRIYSS